MRFWQEKNGVSVIIGTIMIFAILSMLYLSVQVTEVPQWNRQLEWESFERTYDDMVFLKSDIALVGSQQMPKSSAVHMGTRYPDRPFFSNSGRGIAGSLTREDVTVAVQYVIDVAGDPSFTLNYTSSRLIYEFGGSIGGKIVYEHGLIIREYSNGNVTTDNQSLVVNDEIYVPVLETSLFVPVSSMQAVPINLKPYGDVNTRPTIKSVTITLATEYPEVWEDRLDGLDTAETILTVNQVAKTITISSTATRQIKYPQNTGTGGLYAGLITFSTVDPSGFDPDTDFPRIINVDINSVGNATYKKTHSTITATVMNATAPYDIHADLTDLTSDPLLYDEAPDYSSPDSISAGSWSVPNSNTVQWTDIEHPEFAAGEPVAITFFIYNSVLNQTYYRTALTVRLSGDNWR